MRCRRCQRGGARVALLGGQHHPVAVGAAAGDHRGRARRYDQHQPRDCHAARRRRRRAAVSSPSSPGSGPSAGPRPHGVAVVIHQLAPAARRMRLVRGRRDRRCPGGRSALPGHPHRRDTRGYRCDRCTRSVEPASSATAWWRVWQPQRPYPLRPEVGTPRARLASVVGRGRQGHLARGRIGPFHMPVSGVACCH